MRIAMWSGPRNLSTAMMYSFGNRADFDVWDEPFYAPYLKATGLAHPLSEEIISKHDNDAESVARACLESKNGKKPHFYMKHMPHHMIDMFPLEWAKTCVNIHLIRHPARVIASYGNKRSEMTLEDIGFAQQLAVYDKLGGLVIDSADIRQSPEAMLRKLCHAIHLPFDDAMLSWPAGPRKADGIWARHWYNVVHTSTGFAGAEGPLPDLSGFQQKIAEAAMPAYRKLSNLKIPL